MLAKLDKYDFLVSPVAANPAYQVGSQTEDPLAMYKGDLMTVNCNMVGVPAISVPCGFKDSEGQRLPIGLQIIG